jgi:hypothetical protein
MVCFEERSGPADRLIRRRERWAEYLGTPCFWLGKAALVLKSFDRFDFSLIWIKLKKLRRPVVWFGLAVVTDFELNSICRHLIWLCTTSDICLHNSISSS